MLLLLFFFGYSIDILCTVFTMSLAFIFVGFAGSMLSETLQSIRSNTTSSSFSFVLIAAIDRLQGMVYGVQKKPFA